MLSEKEPKMRRKVVAKGGLGVCALLVLAVPAGAQEVSYGTEYEYASPVAVDVYDVVETDIRVEQVSNQRPARRGNPPQQPPQQPAQQQQQQVQQQVQQNYYHSTAEVEATPLVNSRAQSLRRAREGMEVETEQKIVEKLEESRIRDEQRRSDRIFGNKLDNLSEEPAPKKTEPEVVYVEKKPAPEPVMEKEVIEQEVIVAQSIVVEPLSSPSRAFISADLGTSEYPDILNIQGKVATGVGLGVELPNRFVVEGRFRYSGYDLEKVGSDGRSEGFRDVKQYNFGVGLNYKLLETTFTPKIGTSLSYVYRTISEDVGTMIQDNTHSTGMDLGFLAGLDMDINDGFSMGLDFNYFTNLSTRREGESLVHPTSSSHMEDFDYYMITLSGRFFF